MTYPVVESGIFAKGLDPAIGLLHTDAHQQATLAYDLIEPIRPLIDRLLVQLIQNKQLSTQDFVKKATGHRIRKAGKRQLISAFNKCLHQRMSLDQQVRRLKDHIYGLSHQLAHHLQSPKQTP